MKRTYILILLAFLMAAPAVQPTSDAQTTKKERVANQNKKKRRKTRRRTRRRVSRRAHVRYASLTRYSATVKVVPSGAVIVRKSNRVYHYHGGLFYHQVGARYTVVKPIVGVRIKILPARHVRIVVPRGTYYYYYGNYYQKTGATYMVVEAPAGAVVDGIPEGYTIEEINGDEYYVWNDVYYEEIESDDFESGVGYKVTNQG